MRLSGHSLTGVAHEHVHVRIHDHKVVEDFNAFHLTRSPQHFPVDGKPVWVQEAQRPAKIVPSAVGEYFVEQDLVAVTLMYTDTTISGRQTTQFRGPASFKVDEVKPENGGSMFIAFSGLPATASPVVFETCLPAPAKPST